MRAPFLSLSLLIVFLLGSLAGCGSSPPAEDGGGPPGARRDAGAMDGGGLDGGGGADGGASAVCERFAGFTEARRVFPGHSVQALLSKALDRAVLLTHNPSGQGGDVIRVSLPSGTATAPLATGVREIQWVLGETAVLAASGLLLNTQVLTLVPLERGDARVIARNVCSFSVSPDGTRLYVMRDCTTATGSLDLIRLRSGQTEVIAAGAAVAAPVISADSPYAAFVADVAHDPSSACGSLGSLDVLDDVAGTRTRIQAGSVMEGSLAFTPSGQILFRQADRDCPPTNEEYLGFTPGDRAPVSLMTGINSKFLFRGISPDGRFQLAIREVLTSPDRHSDLLVVRTDGSGMNTVASDLLWFISARLRYQPTMLSVDGQHAIYTTVQSSRVSLDPEMGLASVSTSAGGGTPVRLTSTLLVGYYNPSPRPDEVGFIETTSPTGMNAVVASVSTGARRASWAANGIAQSPHFTPDGRALLFIHQEPASGFFTLRFLRVPGDRADVLATWSQSTLAVAGSTVFAGLPYPGAFFVDPSGCVVLFDTDMGPAPGTQLMLLPR